MVSSPVAESAVSSGKDSLVRMGQACHSIASQPSNQPDSQSEAHTTSSAADGLCEPLDRQKSKRIWRSKFENDPSCGCAHAPSHTSHPELTEGEQNQSSVSHRLGRVLALREGVIPRTDSSVDVHTTHPHPTFPFQLASSQCPLSTGEPPEAVTPKRHSAFLRPELFDNLGEKSVACYEGERLPGLDEKEGTTLVRHEADSLFEDRGEGKGSATATVRPVRTVTERSVRSGLMIYPLR